MAGSVNKVILVGNLGKDPEVRNTQQGGKIVNFTLATSENWNDKATGEKRGFSRAEFEALFSLAEGGIAELCALQRKAAAPLPAG